MRNLQTYMVATSGADAAQNDPLILTSRTPHANHPQLTVIVPVFNEIKTIKEVLDKVLQEATRKHLLVVDDGSTDGTVQYIATWMTAYHALPQSCQVCRAIALHHPENRGKGAAIRTALEHTTTEFVIVQDADLEVSPDEYPHLLRPLTAGEVDFVIGYRTQIACSSRRCVHGLGVWLLNMVVWLLYGVTVKDEACCFKVLRTRDLKRMRLACKGFEFCPEVVAKAARLGLRFGEVPISYSPRNVSAGKKLRLRDGLTAMQTLWKYRRWQEHSQD